MSSHPYGLRGDPFASPATLSAKDASRLIRRRVRAFDGDGGALYPIDTCDLIHELAGGIPDAMLEMAGLAMRIAAAEGAPAVFPSHVRKAAEVARSGSAETPVHSDAEFTAETGIAARAQTFSEALDTTSAIAEDDPDLPAFQPASFALPSQPSENLDRDARDWVLRFIPAPGPGPFSGETSRVAHAPGIHDPAAVGAPARRAVSSPSPAPAPFAAAAERAPTVAYAHQAPRRGSRAHGSRRRRRSGNQGLLIAVAAVCVIAFVVRMSLRGSLVPPGTEVARPVPTSAPAPDVRQPTPAGNPTQPVLVDKDPILEARAPAPETSTPGQRPATGTAPVSLEPARRQAPAARFGLEVATFIFEERARVERDRLAASGHRARVLTTLEYGSRVYRVVLGAYPHPAAAERAADSLLSNGLVLQARVVSLP